MITGLEFSDALAELGNTWVRRKRWLFPFCFFTSRIQQHCRDVPLKCAELHPVESCICVFVCVCASKKIKIELTFKGWHP